jgi:hypothetical protein
LENQSGFDTKRCDFCPRFFPITNVCFSTTVRCETANLNSLVSKPACPPKPFSCPSFAVQILTDPLQSSRMYQVARFGLPCEEQRGRNLTDKVSLLRKILKTRRGIPAPRSYEFAESRWGLEEV